jgi:hypothetical protein
MLERVSERTSEPEPAATVPAAPGVESGAAPTGAASAPGIAGVLALYGLARLGLLAVIAGILMAAGTPLVIALLVGLIVALPLSMLLFRGLRARLDSALAVARTQRAAQRDALRAGLRGDAESAGSGPAGSGDRSERQPDGSGG